MIIIGTAGHIDHGKSSIVKRLTGTDPDRLPEEKERGMTIDLGFAFYTTPKNTAIAFVDVPGHERFVKNMIAGAGGIDAVFLVIAADDGWMPQTEEHFQIVRLLGVKTGLIVINKCDLANDDSLKSLRTDIKNKVANSFLENAPIMETSAATGRGFEKLQAALDSLAESVLAGRDIGKPRLYIDRVFVRPGIGHVATGTLKDGPLKVGESINIWPTMKSAKIKTLQTNNENVSAAFPSQRTAVSLTGVGKEELKRGGVITALKSLEYFVENPILALKIELLKNAPVAVENKRKVLLLVGTSESEGELRLLDKNKISGGESGRLLFKPQSPLFTLVGDRVILRLPSPMLTLGGGVVLDHLKSIPSQKNLPQLKYLQFRDAGSLKNLIISELQNKIVVKENDLLQYSSHSNTEISAAINELILESHCGKTDGIVFESETFANAANKMLQTIIKLSTDKKSIGGLTLKEIAVAASFQEDTARVLTNHLIKTGQLQKENDFFRTATSEDEIPPDVKTAYNEILAQLNKNPLMPPGLSELTAAGKTHKEAVRLMLKSAAIHKCGADFIFPTPVWKEFENFIINTFSRKETLSVADFRDQFKITRKFAVPILEEMDKLKLTRRRGDVRIKGEKLEI